MKQTMRTDENPMTPWMYGSGGQGGAMLRGLTGVLAICMLVAILLGLTTAGSDILNPARGPAQADQMAAETEARRAQTEYERKLNDLDLDKQRRLNDIAVASAERKARISEAGRELIMATTAIGIFALSLAAAIYLVTRAAFFVSNRPPGIRNARTSNGRILQYPSHRRPLSSARREAADKDKEG